VLLVEEGGFLTFARGQDIVEKTRRSGGMFREMRRNKQMLPPAEAEEILRRGSSGVLALSGDADYPYALPISYVYDGVKLYFHCAKTGHKLDAIARNPKASFCVVDRDEVIGEKYTTAYRSVIVFGHIRRLEDETDCIRALEKLGRKYAPALDPGAEIKKGLAAACVLEMSVDHITGKEGLELLARRNGN